MDDEVVGNSGAVSNPMASVPVAQPVMQSATIPVQPIGKKSSKLWIWLVVIIVLIIGGISYFLIFANVDDDSSSTSVGDNGSSVDGNGDNSLVNENDNGSAANIDDDSSSASVDNNDVTVNESDNSSSVDVVDNDSDLGSDLPCDLRLDAPEGWKELMDERTLLYIFPFEAGEDSSIARIATIEILVQDFTGKSETLGEYTTDIVEGLKEDEADENILIDFVEDNERTLGGFEGHMAVHYQIPFDSKLMQVWTLVGNSFYFVTYSAKGNEYEEYLSVATDVIDSIEIAGDCYA